MTQQYAAQQTQAPVVPFQAPSPYTPATVTAAQSLDVTSLINSILPIFMLMMVFGMLTPMMKQMSGSVRA